MASSKSSTFDAAMAATTFVQADASTFRAVVQKLTGVTEDSTEKLPVTLPARLSGKFPASEFTSRKSSFKLQERRKNLRKLEIKLGPSSFSRLKSLKGEAMLVSPVSPLDLFSFSPKTPTPLSPSSFDLHEEEKIIAAKGFYLHPSPLNTPRGPELELLPLFPVHSPRDAI